MYAAHVYRGIRASEPNYKFSHPTLRLWAIFWSYIAWMTSVVYFYEYDYNLWVSVVYAFAFRLVFAVLVSAFIIVSTVNSCFQGTWKLIFAPISRLAYSAYIGGLTMQLYYTASTRTPLYFNLIRLTWITIGDITNGFFIAFFLYMLIESPFENLLKLLIGKMKEEIHKAEERTPNDVEMTPRNIEE
ncbi:uncharacterized protein LOC112685687 [Sipha flava]|uniref:Uncharacterized protein LOC112685687 n=1 Tax=Sipha flava TaxID=143950 RepID=A0A8B8FR29_9HEMI|nr:uncharacterized protein LOC112685687 [Sipha flava]XP_025413410.1 uncharacterized protein LOC112685687 [Sipha flava]